MAHKGFWHELKRRHVYRVAAAYAVVGWLLIQAATQVFPFFKIPDWAVRLLVLLVLAGFPIALVLAWAFDATPHGVVRTDAAEGQPVLRRARRGTLVVGGLGLVIAIIAGAGYLVWHRPAPAAQPRKVALDAAPPSSAVVASSPGIASAAPIPDKSVAVLPFLNESGDPKQLYFSDGLSEELISALGQVRGLKVIGRDSSFRFRGTTQDDSATIGAKLGVATLLEGTVRKQGDEVRIVASLIKASDGSQLWSQTYDRQLHDVFAMQSDIATSVAAALKATLLGKTIVVTDKPANGNMAAYDAMLQGRYYAERRNRADYATAVKYYQQAIALDPDYAVVYARLAIAEQWFNDWVANDDERKLASAQARSNARKAVALAPDSAVALGALGINQAWSDFDYPAAERSLKQAVALDPSNAETLYQLADVTACLGRLDEGIAMMRRVLAMEPLNAAYHFYTGQFLLAEGQPGQASVEIKRAIELQPTAAEFRPYLAIAYLQQNQVQLALATAKAEPDPSGRRWALAMVYFAHGDKAQGQADLDQMLRLDAQAAPSNIALVYAVRGDADQTFAWLDRALAARDPGVASLYELPYIIPKFHDDTRLAALLKRLGLPTPAEVKAQVSGEAARD